MPACCQARGALLPHHFTLACALPPLCRLWSDLAGFAGKWLGDHRFDQRRQRGDRAIGGIFLLHFPSARAAQALPGTVPCGARTFLGIDCSMTRLSGRLRHAHCRTCAFSHRRPARFRPRTGPLGRSFVARIRPEAASGGSHAKPRMRCYRSGWLTSTVSPSNTPSGPKRRSWMRLSPSWPIRITVLARVP